MFYFPYDFLHKFNNWAMEERGARRRERGLVNQWAWRVQRQLKLNYERETHSSISNSHSSAQQPWLCVYECVCVLTFPLAAHSYSLCCLCVCVSVCVCVVCWQQAGNSGQAIGQKCWRLAYPASNWRGVCRVTVAVQRRDSFSFKYVLHTSQGIPLLDSSSVLHVLVSVSFFFFCFLLLTCWWHRWALRLTLSVTIFQGFSHS